MLLIFEGERKTADRENSVLQARRINNVHKIILLWFTLSLFLLTAYRLVRLVG